MWRDQFAKLMARTNRIPRNIFKLKLYIHISKKYARFLLLTNVYVLQWQRLHSDQLGEKWGGQSVFVELYKIISNIIYYILYIVRNIFRSTIIRYRSEFPHLHDDKDGRGSYRWNVIYVPLQLITRGRHWYRYPRSERGECLKGNGIIRRKASGCIVASPVKWV